MFDDVGSGATSDLERATETARSMVMDYGMSRLGRVKFREGNRGAFLTGSEGPATRYYSEQTAREIDQEVKRILDEQLDRTRGILEDGRAALDAIANSLIEREVIDGAELQEIIEQADPSPRIVPGTSTERKPNSNSTGKALPPKSKPGDAEAAT